MENKVHPCNRCCWYNPVTCNCEIPRVMKHSQCLAIKESTKSLKVKKDGNTQN